MELILSEYLNIIILILIIFYIKLLQFLIINKKKYFVCKNYIINKL